MGESMDQNFSGGGKPGLVKITPVLLKRALDIISHLPDTNFWHYSLQLNVYKAIIERNYNKKVKDLFLIRLHPNCPHKTYELITCADLRSEVTSLFTHRKLNMNK